MVSDMEGIKIKKKYSQIGSGLLSGAPHSGLLVHQPEWRIQKYLLHLPRPRCWSPGQWSLCAGPPCGAPCRNKWRAQFIGWPTQDLHCFYFHQDIWHQQFTTCENGFPNYDKFAYQKDANIRADVWTPHPNKCQNTMQIYSLIPKHFLKLDLQVSFV